MTQLWNVPFVHPVIFFVTAELIRVVLAELYVFSPMSGTSVPVDPPLWSLHVTTTIFPCATLKKVPFALQFVQPGITTTPLNPSLKHSSGSVPSLTFSVSSTVAFCPFCVQFVFFYFVFVLVFFWQKSKGQSVTPPTQPLGKVTFKQSTAVAYMCTPAHYGQIQGVGLIGAFVVSCKALWDIFFEQTWIDQSILYTCFFFWVSRDLLEPIPADKGREAGYTLNSLPSLDPTFRILLRIMS